MKSLCPLKAAPVCSIMHACVHGRARHMHGRARGVHGRVACWGVHACTGVLGRACMHGRAGACMHARACWGVHVRACACWGVHVS